MHAQRVLILFLVAIPFVRAEDWPQLGRDQSHNAVSPEKDPPTKWQLELKKDGKVIREARNIRWSVPIGSRHATPVIADGLVWVGTNNDNPRDPKQKDDLSVLACFRERDGQFLWQYVSPRIGDIDQDGYSQSLGPPLVESDRLWFVTKRAEVLCFDIAALKKGQGNPQQLWRVDLRKDYGVIPKSGVMAWTPLPSVASYKDWIYVVTGNGRSSDGNKVPAPDAPSLVCLERGTGKLVWKDSSPGKDIINLQHSTPLVVEVDGHAQVIVGQGDGWVRSFKAASGKLLWKCDLNPKAREIKRDIHNRNYAVATPVFADGRVYLASGDDPGWGDGPAHVYCIDPRKEGDVSLELPDGQDKGKANPNSAVVWRFGGPVSKEDKEKFDRDNYFNRSMSNCTVADGLLYVADFEGYIYCLDAKTGKHHWDYDSRAEIWGSPLWVDHKIYIGTHNGDLFVFTHGKEKKEPLQIEVADGVRAAPVFANGSLYLPTTTNLLALQEKK